MIQHRPSNLGGTPPDTVTTVVSVEFARLGYNPEARLVVCPGRGAVYAYVRLNKKGAGEREIPWEPAEPEKQEISVRFALADPAGAVLDLIRVDMLRRRDEAETGES